MEVLWNQINLQRPPYRPWDISVKKFDSAKFIKTIDNILNDFEIFKVLHAEAALLSRLIYRMKSKFRSDKGLKHMEKVNRALLNYLNMSLEREYELLKEYTEISIDIVSLPPQQTLEYVLVRTQGFAKLMSRVESTAMIAANFLKSRLYLGQSWTVAMIAYAVISRIWILSRHIVKKSCTWYDSIYKYAKTFKKVGIPWLPDSYVLPENLANWLNLKWFDEDLEDLSSKDKLNGSIFNLIETIDTVEPDSIIDNLITGHSKVKIEADQVQTNTAIPVTDNIDYGVPVSRESFEKLNPKANQVTKKKVKKREKKEKEISEKKSNLLNMKCEKDVVRLLKTKSYPGFDKLQWSILQKRIKKLLLKLTKNNTCDLDEQSMKKVNRYIKKLTNST